MTAAEPVVPTPRRDPIIETHGDWTITIYDDQPITEGQKYAVKSRIVIAHKDRVWREGLRDSYTIWTVLAHWTDALPDDPFPAAEPVVPDDAHQQAVFAWHAATGTFGERMTAALAAATPALTHAAVEAERAAIREAVVDAINEALAEQSADDAAPSTDNEVIARAVIAVFGDAK